MRFLHRLCVLCTPQGWARSRGPLHAEPCFCHSCKLNTQLPRQASNYPTSCPGQTSLFTDSSHFAQRMSTVGCRAECGDVRPGLKKNYRHSLLPFSRHEFPWDPGTFCQCIRTMKITAFTETGAPSPDRIEAFTQLRDSLTSNCGGLVRTAVANKYIYIFFLLSNGSRAPIRNG